MSILKSTLVLFFILSCASIYGQKNSNIEHILYSNVFKKDRTIKVFLPDRYHQDSTSTFIVTYILDAQSDSYWNMAKGNIGYMVRSYTVIPMIAVGIVSDDRGSEFEAGSHQLKEHFEKEVFPFIEKNYRVKSFKSVVGHSWGGSFIGSTLFSEQRDLFDAYIGISPSFGDTDNVITKAADSMLKAKSTFGKYLYFSHGDVGSREAEFGGYVATIDSLIKKYPNPSLAWTPKLFEGTDHWQIVIPSINDGLMCMSRNYFADQKIIEDLAKSSSMDLKSAIKNFNIAQKQKFGFVHQPGVKYLNFVANDFRDRENYKRALELYQLALDKKPDDVKVFVNISDTYDKLGNIQMAKTSFIKTLELLEDQKDDVSEAYYQNVSKWIKEKLLEYK